MRKKKLTRHVGILLTENVYQQLIQVTNKAEKPMSEYIRSLVEEKFNQGKESINE